jgi:hydroxyacylglutathione hydrolase
MQVKVFTCNPFQTNGYVCHDEREAVLVDPSWQAPQEQQAVVDYIQRKGLVVRHLLLTHAHIDHIFGCTFSVEHFGQGIQMHREDVPLLKRAEEQAMFFDVPIAVPPAPAAFLQEGDTIAWDASTWRVLHTPGHSPGSVCFVDEANRFVIGGDVLFAGSIGRTDLPGGSLPQLLASIFQKLLPLGDDVTVYPGHGPATTLGQERRANPFLREFASLG